MSNANQKILDIQAILQLIPHRYPMLLIDRVIDYEHGKYAVALKNVTYNEQFFQGHFPKQAIMPGVLIIEAMAQTASALVSDEIKLNSNDLVFFMSVDKAKFRNPVIPGDQLIIRADFEQKRGPVWRFACTAKVGETLCTEAIITAMIKKN